eukprot:SAG11_NODE_4816_length_1756_cov_2.062764_1_plen_28_part_10
MDKVEIKCPDRRLNPLLKGFSQYDRGQV